ncbi:hypothetical protein Vadar_006124 [Vaccinium darrowii]|uniref:Uncharacterized protein n=1 Tax=Vaccinium darrowii TaxID=229202 RepID=A0ACB7YBV5_9ERIC|nr:hypothetical protein Vadar_006124 [Vaccinium darrowii]
MCRFHGGDGASFYFSQVVKQETLGRETDEKKKEMSYREARRFVPPPPLAVPVPTYVGPFQYQPPSTSTSRHVGYKSKRETRCYLCNDELYEAYRRKIEENDNFDVDPCPNCCRGSLAPGIQRVHHSVHPADHIRVYSEIALMKYNEKEGSDLELVKVVKANVKVVNGFVYYITFDAEDASSGQNSMPNQRGYNVGMLIRSPTSLESLWLEDFLLIVLCCSVEPRNFSPFRSSIGVSGSIAQEMYYQPREIPPHLLLLPPLPPPPPPPKVNPSHQLRLLEAYTDPYGRAYARSIFQKYETSPELMTQKEMNEYHRLVKERDGFDVMPSIKGYGKGILMPVVLDQKKVAHKLKIFSELALMEYCSRERLRTDLQFVKVVKANYEVENGYVYYITFDAKDPSAGQKSMPNQGDRMLKC